jgi:hypothetical protein
LVPARRTRTLDAPRQLRSRAVVRSASGDRLGSRASTMRIITWNVNGRVDEACRRQLDCVLAVEPDVLALQEVTLASYPAWCAGLVQASYSVVSSIYLVNLPYPEVQPPISRRYFKPDRNPRADRHAPRTYLYGPGRSQARLSREVPRGSCRGGWRSGRRPQRAPVAGLDSWDHQDAGP